MKLKLDEREGVRILTVTEEVNANHAPILRAGLLKLFAGEKKQIAVDLSGVTSLNDAALSEFMRLKELAPEHGADLSFVSAKYAIGDAPNLEDLLKKLNSPLANLLSMEAKLQAKYRKSQRMKKALEGKLDVISKQGLDLKALRKDNHELKRQVDGLEKNIEQLIKERGSDPVGSTELKTKMATLDRLLTRQLEESGILSGGSGGAAKDERKEPEPGKS